MLQICEITVRTLFFVPNGLFMDCFLQPPALPSVNSYLGGDYQLSVHLINPGWKGVTPLLFKVACSKTPTTISGAGVRCLDHSATAHKYHAVSEWYISFWYLKNNIFTSVIHSRKFTVSSWHRCSLQKDDWLTWAFAKRWLINMSVRRRQTSMMMIKV